MHFRNHGGLRGIISSNLSLRLIHRWRDTTICGVVALLLQACAGQPASSTLLARQPTGSTTPAEQNDHAAYNYVNAPWRFPATTYQEHLAPWANVAVTASNFSPGARTTIVRQPSNDPFFDILLYQDGVLSPTRMCFAGLGQCAQQ